MQRCSIPHITVLLQALHRQDCAILINERLINCPAEVSPALQKLMLEDLDAAEVRRLQAGCSRTAYACRCSRM